VGRFAQVSGNLSRRETAENGSGLTGGQVVAGSNPVSQTLSARHCQPDTVSPTKPVTV
jgi:hypothetical protein